MGNKILFDAYTRGGSDRLQIARRPDVVGELRTSPDTPDTTTANPRPATSDYPDFWEAGYQYAPWGLYAGDDNLPNRLEYKADLVPLIRQIIKRNAQMLTGNGIIYVLEKDLARTAAPERQYLPDVEDFMDANQLETEWWFPQATEWGLHGNVFSEMKLSMSRRFITNLFHKESPFCRLSTQDARGVIRYLLYDAKFAWNEHQGGGEANPSGSATAMPLLTWWDAQRFFDQLKGDTFAWHTRIRSGRSPYYPKPPHVGLFRTDGWVDVAADVPRIVKSMQSNQIQLKYLISVEESYFKIAHPDWENYTAEQRESALNKFEDAINDKFVGVDRLYKSIVSVWKFDPMQNKELGKIEITAIDDKVKSDTWKPGAEGANFEIVHGFGQHPTNFGLSRENGSMGSGSGSDKREVYNTTIDTNTIEQKYLLGPLNFASRFNRWGVRFLIDHTAHTTSNLSESGSVPSQNTIQPANAGGKALNS